LYSKIQVPYDEELFSDGKCQMTSDHGMVYAD
jgi:hypothetical protein